MKKVKVIQGNYHYGDGWEDLSEYEIPEEKDKRAEVEAQIQHDLNEYRYSGYEASYRVKVRYE